ncbi:MAG: hypothetical protein JMJ93_04080 [Synergistaceae bacterium]|nr:hypothetical protein [Synergistaceae bacterium]
MRKNSLTVTVLLLSSLLFALPAPVGAEEKADYDPLYTMLAINACVVSVSETLHYGDRLVLQQEYDSIINNIRFGNVEADDELVSLFQSLLAALHDSLLREAEKEAFLRAYQRNMKRTLLQSLTAASSTATGSYGAIVEAALAAGSTYFDHRNRLDDYRVELGESLWNLDREQRRQLNELQQKLLATSWKLQRRWGLDDGLRLTQQDLAVFHEALSDGDAQRRFRRLERLRDRFVAYPPFWYVLGRTAQELGRRDEALKAYEAFERNWRPLFRHDPFYAAVAMNRAELRQSDEAAKLREDLEILLAHSPIDGGANRLYAGLRYLDLGDRERARACFQQNLDENYERELHLWILRSLDGGTSAEALIGELQAEAEDLTEQLLAENGLRTQDLLLLYDREKDRTVLRKIEEDLSAISLELIRRRAQRDTVALSLPEGWVTGRGAFQRDNHFVLSEGTFVLTLVLGETEAARFRPDDVRLLKPSSERLSPRGGETVIGYDPELQLFAAYGSGSFPGSFEATLTVTDGDDSLVITFEGRKEDPKLFAEGSGLDYAIPVLGQIRLLKDLVDDSSRLVTEAIVYEPVSLSYRGKVWPVAKGKLVGR